MGGGREGWEEGRRNEVRKNGGEEGVQRLTLPIPSATTLGTRPRPDQTRSQWAHSPMALGKFSPESWALQVACPTATSATREGPWGAACVRGTLRLTLRRGDFA
jgi:hypothetical protein